MKKVLQFSGLIAAVIAIASFVLMMTCPSVNRPVYDTVLTGKLITTIVIPGTSGIFGGDWPETGSTVADAVLKYFGATINATPTAIIAFVLAIVGVAILVLGAILPILKIKALNKFAGLLNLIAVIALVAAGILIFVQVPAFLGAQASEGSEVNTAGWNLGAGWIIAGICAIVAGVIAIAPAFADFLAKGKKK